MKPRKLKRDDSMLSQLSDVTLCFACCEESQICNSDGYTPAEASPPDFDPLRLQSRRRLFSSSASLDASRHPLNYEEYEEESAASHSLPEHMNCVPSSKSIKVSWPTFEQNFIFNKTADDLCTDMENQLKVVHLLRTSYRDNEAYGAVSDLTLEVERLQNMLNLQMGPMDSDG